MRVYTLNNRRGSAPSTGITRVKIINDFIGQYYAKDQGPLKLADIRDVKGALLGKPVDNITGVVNHSAPPTTPHRRTPRHAVYARHRAGAQELAT